MRRDRPSLVSHAFDFALLAASVLIILFAIAVVAFFLWLGAQQ